MRHFLHCGEPSTSIEATPYVPLATMCSASTRKASMRFSMHCA